MAITKRPTPSRPDAASDEDQERKIEAFIAGTEATTMMAESEPKRARVMMRFDPGLLRQIDAAAKRRGVSRTAWLHMVASRALDQGEG
jgi:predicted DNA binding CopG/RHH family protein